MDSSIINARLEAHIGMMKEFESNEALKASLLAAAEMIRTGTSTFNDHYWHHLESYRAASEMGLRIATGYEVMDKDDPAEAERQKEQCCRMYERAMKEWCGNSKYQVAFHAIYSVSEELMLWISNFARQHGLNLHIHLSETRKEIEDCMAMHGGLTPVEYLDSLGEIKRRLYFHTRIIYLNII